ncbi:MAG TPA: VOC family protein [Solirubrobacterales bacterium]
MSERDDYPHGVPCWVEGLVPDPEGMREFYSGVFGWEFEGPGKMPGEESSAYFVARLRGRDVAGIGSLPQGVEAATWVTHIRADDADAAADAVRAAGGSVVVEPLDVPPVGRMAVLDDPTGARFVAWEAEGREGAQIVNEPAAWSMSSLVTPDPEAAAAFYVAVFGWETMELGPGMTVFRLPGFVGGEPGQPVPRDVVAVMAATEDADGAFWQADFWIDDIEAVAATAVERGGEVVEPPAEFPGAPFISAVLADPAGARLSVSQKLPEAA